MDTGVLVVTMDGHVVAEKVRIPGLLVLACGFAGAWEAPIPASGRGEQGAPAILLVVEGSPTVHGRAAERLAGELTTALDSGGLWAIAFYDTEPSQTGEMAVHRPRTPLREAVEAGFARLNGMPQPRVMVVIGREQFYPSAIREDQLIHSARRAQVTVHTMHIGEERGGGFFRGCTRSLKQGVIWLLEAIGEDDHSYPAESTAKLMRRLSTETGGKACTTADERGGVSCPDEIAQRIAGGGQRYPEQRRATGLR